MEHKNRRQFAAGRGIFVTATGTGVGKSMVAGAIAWNLRLRGVGVGVFKPIATGCDLRREGLVSRDAEFLAHCSNSELNLEQINPVRYREPLAPWVAVERAKRQIDWEELTLSYQNVVDSSELVIVEGIGGVMVPISRNYLVIDLMADMSLPVVIVADSRLGTINHTLLTVEACRGRGLEIAGIVLNGYRADLADLAEESNGRVLAELSGLKILAVIPYEKGSCVEKGQLGPEVIAAAGMVRWDEIARQAGG